MISHLVPPSQWQRSLFESQSLSLGKTKCIVSNVLRNILQGKLQYLLVCTAQKLSSPSISAVLVGSIPLRMHAVLVMVDERRAHGMVTTLCYSVLILNPINTGRVSRATVEPRTQLWLVRVMIPRIPGIASSQRVLEVILGILTLSANVVKVQLIRSI